MLKKKKKKKLVTLVYFSITSIISDATRREVLDSSRLRGASHPREGARAIDNLVRFALSRSSSVRRAPLMNEWDSRICPNRRRETAHVTTSNIVSAVSGRRSGIFLSPPGSVVPRDASSFVFLRYYLVLRVFALVPADRKTISRHTTNSCVSLCSLFPCATGLFLSRFLPAKPPTFVKSVDCLRRPRR